jgi:outer membrane lipoprotein-sorting protein
MKSLAALALLIPTIASADPKGMEYLGKVDHMMNNFSDGVFESKLLVKTPDGSSREYGFTTYQKVPDKRLVRFSAPGDVKGMGVLVENKDTMYVFLPGFQRVRRMGTHIKNQTFMGSDFSYEDMSQTVFSPFYEANVEKEDDKTVTLDMKQKAGTETEFPHVKMVVDKTMSAPLKMEYFDASGKKLKTQMRDGYKKDEGRDYYSPGRVMVIDHRRNDHTSEIHFTSFKLNSNLADDLFSQRSLIRGQ